MRNGEPNRLKAVLAILLAFAMVMSLAACESGTAKEENEKIFFACGGELMMYEVGEESAQAVADIKGDLFDTFSSSDGKTLYYIIDQDDYCGDLYYLDLSEFSGEKLVPEKVTGNVYEYAAELYDDRYFIYMKNDKLYVNEGGVNTKITGDAYTFQYSGGKIFYMLSNDDRDAYVVPIAYPEEGDKVGSNIDVVVYMSDDLSEIAYVTQNYLADADAYDCDLHVWKNGKNEVIAERIGYYDYDLKGKVYYTMPGEQTSTPLYEYVTDEYLASDSAIKEPEMSEFQYEETVDGVTYASVDMDAYDAACDEYLSAQNRNRIREDLKEEDDQRYYFDLYLWEKGESRKIGEGVANFYTVDDAIIIRKGGPDIIEKLVDVSDLSSAYDVYDYINDSELTYDIYMSTDDKNIDKLVFINEGFNESFGGVSRAGDDWYTSVFRYDPSEDTSTQHLHLASLKPGQDASLKKIAECDTWFVLDDLLFYITNLDRDGLATLYVYKDGKTQKISEDVYNDAQFIRCIGEDRYLYLKDACAPDGSLWIYDNGENKKIGDDVQGITYRNDTVVFIEDPLGDGTDMSLYIWQGEAKKLIAEHVTKCFLREY